MTSPDLDALARVSCFTAVRPPFGFLRSRVPALLASSFLLFGAAQCRAQDQNQDQTQSQKDQSVAEAARQERARKENLQKKPKHVYTADDLKLDHILAPEDRAQLEARKNQQLTIPTNTLPQDAVAASGSAQEVNTSPNAGGAAASADSANVPLGDVARRFRRERQSQHLQRSAEFHLPFANAPVLASPKAPAQPLVPPAVTVAPPTVVQPAPRVIAPLRPFVKRSPFERPRVLPAPPVISAPRTIVPAPLSPRVIPVPSVPRASLSPRISGKLVLVTVQPGDTLWKFAASRLGDGRRWQELLALNPGLRNPDVLPVGSEIVVPCSVPPPAPAKYTVRHGDTLWSIAQTQLHRGAAWNCIAKANLDLRDARLIREGEMLLLPSSCLP